MKLLNKINVEIIMYIMKIMNFINCNTIFLLRYINIKYLCIYIYLLTLNMQHFNNSVISKLAIIKK